MFKGRLEIPRGFFYNLQYQSEAEEEDRDGNADFRFLTGNFFS